MDAATAQILTALSSMGGAGVLAAALYVLYSRQRDDSLKEREKSREESAKERAVYREDSARDREAFRQECGALRNLFSAEQAAARELYRAETQKERDATTAGYGRLSSQLNEIQSLQARVHNQQQLRRKENQ